MRVLIVEDDAFKKRAIEAFLEESKVREIDNASSTHTAKSILKKRSFDYIIMDMSLPTYDVSAEEGGGMPRTFGGRELLSYMKYKKIGASVIVLTQFERFNNDKGEIDINSLRKTLSTEFPDHFVSLVYFSHIDDVWRHELKSLLEVSV